ncbi:Oligopeptidase A [Diplonema papillatum]|nr:Oligopeptidase A [Diplonema papillatum]
MRRLLTTRNYLHTSRKLQRAKMTAPTGSTVQEYIDEMNTKYDLLHRAFEDNFWATKMNLKGNSSEQLSKTKTEYESFLQNKQALEAVRQKLNDPTATDEQKRILKTMERTYLCYLMESDEAASIKELCVAKESELEAARNKMKLGYTDPKTNEFKPASSVLLSTVMRTNDDEATRKACFEGIQSICSFVVGPLCEVAKLRNSYSKKNGYGDYYEYKIQTTEGFDKQRLFDILDDLEQKTRPMLLKAREQLAEEKGEGALQPWNMGYKMAGSVTKAMDPYFPFEDAVSAWARSFAALGIQYSNSLMNLDLCDREGKYANGFCHWPQCPYVKPNGEKQTCITNFTSVATPSAVGSGYTATATLLHEGGHAAAFANIEQPSPFFAQERAPMSVAYAENQSMFLDSLVGDASWLARYAKSTKGETIPWSIIEEKIRKTHAYKVFQIRSMLVVPYFEKALYELSDDEMTPERVTKIAAEVEEKIFGGSSSRPVLCVPHILADESSCYYQGYVLAEMSVFQTRKHFLTTYGKIVDDPRIGKDLAEIYWKPGNSEDFLDLVKKMTGKPLSADAWVEDLQLPTEDLIKSEKVDYDEALKIGAKFDDSADITKLLNMRIRLVHGDYLIADSETDGFQGCCKKFKQWIPTVFPPEK